MAGAYPPGALTNRALGRPKGRALTPVGLPKRSAPHRRDWPVQRFLANHLTRKPVHSLAVAALFLLVDMPECNRNAIDEERAGVALQIGLELVSDRHATR